MKNNAVLLLTLCISLASYGQTVWTKNGNTPVLRRDTNTTVLSNDLLVNSDPWVLKEGQTYKMWYTAGGANYPPDTLLRSRICYATSGDGIHWTKYAGNPVIDVNYTGGWDSTGVETITVLIDSAAPSSQRYKAWYAGASGEPRYDIGYAWSADGISWTKYSLPVLTVGDTNEWDNLFLEGPSVIKDGSTFKMWYAGYDGTIDGKTTDGKVNVGYATSSDGIHWTKYAGNPVLKTSAAGWDMLYVQDPHVIKKNGTYHLWYGGVDTAEYGGYGQQTGYATSTDGIHWTKYAQNPVLTRGSTNAWDHNLASFPSVLFDDDGTMKMWYTGRSKEPQPNDLNYYWEIGLATAPSFVAINQPIQNRFREPAVSLHMKNDSRLLICRAEKYPLSLSIYNARGILIKHIAITTSGTSIDVSALSAGLYCVHSNNQPHANMRFVMP